MVQSLVVTGFSPQTGAAGTRVAITGTGLGSVTDVQFSGNTYFFFAPLVIPLVILGVPLIDTVFSFVRRVARGVCLTRRAPARRGSRAPIRNIPPRRPFQRYPARREVRAWSESERRISIQRS